MSKNGLRQEQVLQQKLSLQNIQLFKMMELNLLQFDQKVKEELDVNPALEDIDNAPIDGTKLPQNIEVYNSNSTKEVISLGLDQYTMNGDFHNDYADNEERDFFIPASDNETIIGNLYNQLTFLDLTDEQMLIGEFIIGSLEDDGYLRRTTESIVDDLSFRQNFYTNESEVEHVLEIIQELDPPGIGARNLQECLLLQLMKKKHNRITELAIKLVSELFDAYTKKHYDKIIHKLKTNEIEFEKINTLILSLNPKPIELTENILGKYIIPDFFVYRNDNELELELHSYNKPNLSINDGFVEMLKKIKQDKKKSKQEQEMQEYMRDNIQKANVFISLIKERQETMVIIMNTILKIQENYFFSGDESDLLPMGLKDISEKTHFDISTVSRITSTKYVQTEFGIIPLKSLFSEGIKTKDGEVSNKKIMNSLKDLIETEDKANPYSDDELTNELAKLGYNIARRTTAKYRENLKIPPKNYRKQVLSL